jgi:hypothetical protein
MLLLARDTGSADDVTYAIFIEIIGEDAVQHTKG